MSKEVQGRKSHVEQVSTVIIAIAAVAVAAVVVTRELRDLNRVARGTQPPRQGIEYDSSWSELASTGLTIGPAQAPVTIVEFADLECPACRRVHSVLNEALTARSEEVRLVVHHFPLEMHRFARQAAQALECAEGAGAARGFLDATYRHQDSIGLRPWEAFAREAGVLDLPVFEECRSSRPEHPRIENGLRLGRAHGIRATPTVLVNGWRFRLPPEQQDIDEVVDALLAGRTPVLR